VREGIERHTTRKRRAVVRAAKVLTRLAALVTRRRRIWKGWLRAGLSVFTFLPPSDGERSVGQLFPYVVAAFARGQHAPTPATTPS
jgi:hypothetical protein